jgi:hypothetical protein
VIRRRGGAKFGPLPESIQKRLNAIQAIEELEVLSLKRLEVSSWEELLPEPNKKSTRRKKQ